MLSTKTVAIRVIFKAVVNGSPTLERREGMLDLPVTDEALKAQGTVGWTIKVAFGDTFERQEGVTVRSTAGEFPITLAMKADDLRTLVESEDYGTADVELPVRVEIEEGKEFIRDKDGRPQGVVDRRFAQVSWDAPAAA